MRMIRLVGLGGDKFLEVGEVDMCGYFVLLLVMSCEVTMGVVGLVILCWNSNICFSLLF